MAYNADEMGSKLKHLRELLEMEKEGLDKSVVQAMQMDIIPTQLVPIFEKSFKLLPLDDEIPQRQIIEPLDSDINTEYVDSTQLVSFLGVREDNDRIYQRTYNETREILKDKLDIKKDERKWLEGSLKFPKQLISKHKERITKYLLEAGFKFKTS